MSVIGGGKIIVAQKIIFSSDDLAHLCIAYPKQIKTFGRIILKQL